MSIFNTNDPQFTNWPLGLPSLPCENSYFGSPWKSTMGTVEAQENSNNYCDVELDSCIKQFLPQLFNDFTAASNTNLVTASSKAPRKDQNRVRRPLNAFMLYRRDMKHIILDANPGMNQREVSKEIASMWKKASNEVRRNYNARATELRTLHKIENPDFKYCALPKAPKRHYTRKNRDQSNKNTSKASDIQSSTLLQDCIADTLSFSGSSPVEASCDIDQLVENSMKSQLPSLNQDCFPTMTSPAVEMLNCYSDYYLPIAPMCNYETDSKTIPPPSLEDDDGDEDEEEEVVICKDSDATASWVSNTMPVLHPFWFDMTNLLMQPVDISDDFSSEGTTL
ncbi:uncharacterized protein VTP21DRAFT_2732 [Calcarisporiella thermophila]|uniref:uncharacterized protein n=1 Tax=Calcarisporiella thermophila TaxID=911321 RepID=UPI0037425614